MKKAYLLLLIPFAVAGCKSGGSKSGGNGDFAPEYHVEENKKGQKISNQEANSIARQIAQNMEQYDSSKPEAFLEKATLFSYSFKNVIDDSTYIYSKVNYSSADEYFSQSAAITAYDEGRPYHFMADNYEYALGNQVVEAYYSHESHTGYYWLREKEGYKFNGIFSFLSEMILNCGNQLHTITQNMDTYGNMPSQSGMTIEFRSSGAGNLYFKFDMPSYGITLESLFEDYWLTYEYMYTDLTAMQKYMPDGFELEYDHMVTELHIDFHNATIVYPDLSTYTLYN